MMEAINSSPDNIKDLFENVASKVGVLNGGSAVPLWNSWLQGMADVAPDSEEASLEELKAMFSNGMEEFDFMSGAAVGDKTITVEYEGQTAQFKVTVKYVWWQQLIRIFLLGFIWY